MILKSKLPSFLRRWLYGYLTGREQRTQYEGQLSKSIKLKSGVPQGGVLSPFLFCWYMKDMPKPSEGVEIICYADDITVLAQDKEPLKCVNRINQYLKDLSEYFERMQLIPSPDKCKALLVSSWNKEWKMELGIKLGKSPIETVKKTTLLGVEFDQGMTFKEHINKLCTKTTKRNNALKAISSKSQSLQKEELRTVYKALTRSVFHYACPAWTPHISKTN